MFVQGRQKARKLMPYKGIAWAMEGACVQVISSRGQPGHMGSNPLIKTTPTLVQRGVSCVFTPRMI